MAPSPSPSRFRPAIIALALVAPGCREELGPESFPTARVRGVVRAGARPVAGGWIVFEPVEGTMGNLRVAPIRPDGTFDADRVAIGRVAVGLDRIAAGPVDVRPFQTGRSTIRRAIPDRREVELAIDLLDEAGRARPRGRGGRRRRNRSTRKSRRGTPGEESAGVMTDGVLPRSEPRVRVIYRDGAGKLHLDWPTDRIAEAIADAGGTAWVDIEDLAGANNASVEAMLRDVFRFHPLAVEDALQDSHIPKIDDWGGYIYLVVDTIDFDPESDDLRLHELDVFLGPNFLVTYHNERVDVLERHRRHIEREPENRLSHGAGHLLYRLLDEVVAEFLPAIEHLDDAIDDAQDEVFQVPTPLTLKRIFHVKRCALRLHRIVIPMREVLNRLARDPYGQVSDEHRVYFRDVYDHLVRIHDIVESLRDLISGALDTYLSVVSNRTNDIMKALTLVNVMFLPMSFLAGFFGMNFFGAPIEFAWMPVSKGVLFTAACAVMLGMPVGMGILAWRRGWF